MFAFVLFQNQTNSHIRSSTVDRKAVGGPVDNARSRKCPNSSVLPTQYLRMNSAHQPSNMISLSTSNNLKFDRSLSEPSDTRMASSQNQLSHINSNKYKTELCRSYDESRQCKYGEKCRYAHGSTELRTPARHPKYKTEPCRTYHSSGFCPYGPRCHFIHNEYERKNTQSPNNGPTNNSGGSSPTNLNQGTVVKENSNQSGQQHGTSNSSLSPQHSPTLPLFQPRMSTNSTSFANTNSNGGNVNFGMMAKPIKFNSASSSSLGSTADSPPSSATDSPTLRLSPLFFGDDFPVSTNNYTLSSSPSSSSSSPSSSSSSSPLSSSSSSISMSGPIIDELLSATDYVKSAFEYLTISKCSHDLSTSRFDMPEQFFLEDEILHNWGDRSNFIHDESFFSDNTTTDLYDLNWQLGGFPDYGHSLLQTSD